MAEGYTFQCEGVVQEVRALKTKVGDRTWAVILTVAFLGGSAELRVEKDSWSEAQAQLKPSTRVKVRGAYKKDMNGLAPFIERWEIVDEAAALRERLAELDHAAKAGKPAAAGRAA